MIKRLSRSVGILAKVKPFLNTKALLNLCYAIFHSRLQYGLITWSSTFKSYLKKLSTLQNKAVKIVGGGKYYDRATQFYAKLLILKGGKSSSQFRWLFPGDIFLYLLNIFAIAVPKLKQKISKIIFQF